jgi:hypothetical protein
MQKRHTNLNDRLNKNNSIKKWKKKYKKKRIITHGSSNYSAIAKRAHADY